MRPARGPRALVAAGLAAATGFAWLHAAQASPVTVSSPWTVANASDAPLKLREPYDPKKKMQQLIRLLYVLLGGDPANLDGAVSLEAEMMMLVDFYAANGVPPDLTAEEQSQGRLWVEEMFNLAIVLAPQVDPQVLDLFVSALESIYADLGGDPTTLRRVQPAGN